MILQWAFLIVALTALVMQASSLRRLLVSRTHGRYARGLVRTAVSRVCAAVAYVLLAAWSLRAPDPDTGIAAIVVFCAVQGMWIVNGLLDVALLRSGEAGAFLASEQQPRHRR